MIYQFPVQSAFANIHGYAHLTLAFTHSSPADFAHSISSFSVVGSNFSMLVSPFFLCLFSAVPRCVFFCAHLSGPRRYPLTFHSFMSFRKVFLKHSSSVRPIAILSQDPSSSFIHDENFCPPLHIRCCIEIPCMPHHIRSSWTISSSVMVRLLTGFDSFQKKRVRPSFSAAKECKSDADGFPGRTLFHTTVGY